MKKTASIVLLAVAVASFWLASTLHEPLADARMRQGLEPVEALENAPPLVVFTTIVLGGFRGLLADILWLRASHLQERGRYFELVQLSDWITKLEPRHTEVWAFHAWNMAYNASVMMPDPRDRWRWISNGIELLRKEGLRYNPGDPLLYRELGWLFQNKIGGITDRDSMVYRRLWAREMIGLFGGGSPDYDVLEASDAGRRAEEEYVLVPGIMRAVDARYGPLDWRLPETHALYWAHRGLTAAGTEISLPCDRMVYQALGTLFLQGSLLHRPGDNIYITTPNLDLLPRVITAFEAARQRHGDTIDGGYRSFLREAIILLDMFDRKNEARDTFERLHRLFPDEETAAGLEGYLELRHAEDAFDKVPKRRAIALVEGRCYRSLLLLASGKWKEGVALRRQTQREWQAYLAGKTEEDRQRFGLPSFAQILQRAHDRASRELPADMLQQIRAYSQEWH